MPRRHAVLALVVAVCWAVNFVVIDIGLDSFPALLFAALRFGLIASHPIFFVPRPDVRWLAVVAVGLFICVGRFGLLFVAMHIGPRRPLGAESRDRSGIKLAGSASSPAPICVLTI